MKILVIGSNILAMEPLAETGSEIASSDAIYPKHVIPDWQIVDVDAPEGFRPQDYEYFNGAVYHKPVEPTHPTVEEYTDYVRNWMNVVAAERGYDSIITASLRAALSESPYHEEGVIFGSWMDSIWFEHFRLLGQANGGMMPWPTLEEHVAMLPIKPEFVK